MYQPGFLKALPVLLIRQPQKEGWLELNADIKDSYYWYYKHKYVYIKQYIGCNNHDVVCA